MRSASQTLLVGAALAALAAVAVPAILPPYWVFLATTAVVSAVALQSLGVVSGRAGMLSLCQLSFAAVGAWVVAWLNVHDAPGNLLLWLPLGGLAAVPFGLLVGVPALRLRTINLAVATLAFAVCADVVLSAGSFPGQAEFEPVPRPPGFETDEQYFVLCVIAFTVIALMLSLIARTRVGASWVSLAHSERATAAQGISVPRAKLSAFALSAFIAGVSGGLLAGQLGTLVADNFDVMQSLVLFALAMFAGSQHPEGALMGGALSGFFPELLRRVDLPQDLGNVLFAVGATQALSMGASQSEALRGALRRRRAKRVASQVEREPPAAEAPSPAADGAPPVPPPAASGAPALAVEGLTVRFGSVVAVDGVDLVVPNGTVVALVGPNGAGKSTLIDAVTGFLTRYEGSVTLAGRSLDGLSAHRRARAGVRRTFQHTRLPPDLTAGQYVRMASGRHLEVSELNDLLRYFDCPPPEMPIASVDVGSRRVLDVAGAVAARPRVLLLDEPAAGQDQEESARLAGQLATLPERYGTSVLLVEHDIDLVRSCASEVTVLDFGKVLASGPPDRALAEEAVVKAYLGVAEVPVA